MSILDFARSHFRQAIADPAIKQLPDPGWRWHAYCLHAREIIERFKTPIEVIHSVQAPGSNAGFEARMVGMQLREHAQVMEENCRQLFPQYADKLAGFAESDLSYPDSLELVNGRLVSSPLYNHIIHTLRCLTFVQPERVLEIGGGYGAPGRVWMTNSVHRPQLYIDVDFPESLFYADVYLRATLPDLPIVYIGREQDLRDITNASPGPRIVLCPVHNLHLLANIDVDLIVNTGSLQEMSDDYVAFYMTAIDRARCRWFYSANYFAQPIDQLMEGMNFAAPVLGAEWNARFCELHGDPPRPVAELMLQRDRPDLNASSRLTEWLARGLPRSLKEFLTLFDAARKVQDPELLLSLARAAYERMPYVPKETLYLVRRARQLSKVRSPQAVQFEQELNRLAARGREQMGLVDPAAARHRNTLMYDGRLLSEDGKTAVELGTAKRPMREGTFGVVERLEAAGSLTLVSGWALDQQSGEPPLLIHFFKSGTLIKSVAPTIARPEFQLTNPVIGFETAVPQCDLEEVVVMAEFADGAMGRVEAPVRP